MQITQFGQIPIFERKNPQEIDLIKDKLGMN